MNLLAGAKASMPHDRSHVIGQIVERGITDSTIIAAMRQFPRYRFIPYLEFNVMFCVEAIVPGGPQIDDKRTVFTTRQNGPTSTVSSYEALLF